MIRRAWLLRKGRRLDRGDVLRLLWKDQPMRRNTPTMRAMLKRAARKARGLRAPADGSMVNILYGDLTKDGKHWQVELIHDLRMHPRPYIDVCCWPSSDRGGFAPWHLVGNRSGEVIK